MDADFQDPPEVVPQLIHAWRSGAEVVVAVRRSRQESRKILALLFPLFYRVLGAISDYPLSLNAGLFGLMDRKAVDSILEMGEKNPYLPGLRAWVGYRNTTVYYDRQDRLSGEGKLSFMSRIKYATDAIMSFSYKPIRLSLVLCCVATCLAFLLGLGALITSSPIREAALGVGCAVFLMGGLMLLAMGVLGEYIIRIFDQVRGRPLSLISQVHRAPAELLAQSGAISIHNGTYAVQPEAYSGKADSFAA
jgi:dolichol-phosphate mannosyltransferase